MNIKCHDIGFPYIEVENFYTPNELSLIWEEINFLYYDHKLTRSYGSAETPENGSLKNNRCIYLDEFYQKNRHLSNILTVNRKLCNNYDRIIRSHNSWFFKNVKISSDETSFSYYEDGDSYKSHADGYILTSLFWTYKEPKRFSGGKFIFSDYNHEIEVKNNKMLIFPSCIMHEVTPVVLDKKYSNQKMGRICISNFMSIF